MDTMMAYALGELTRNQECKVFDWDKAAKIIKERDAKDAWAGLNEDYRSTGGMILEDGKIVKDPYVFLASTWDIPTLYVGGDEIPCYVMESQTEWDESTKWPESAVKILMSE